MATLLRMAIDKLGVDFNDLDLTFHQIPGRPEGDVTSYFPGSEDEDVLVCVFQGKDIHEPFHRQDFFFINYAYKGSYEALSARFDNQITIHEDECYISQPYCGYALRGHSESEIEIIGILIRKDAFFREYLPVLSSDAGLFRFFLEPQKDRFSDEFIHLAYQRNHPVRRILELMVIEYADKAEGTQAILKSLTLALLQYIIRTYRQTSVAPASMSLCEQIIQTIADHMDSVSLNSLSRQFSYHPTYISALLRKETGKTFSEIVLEKRMERAVSLMRYTTLSLEEIAVMIGYGDHSNFYKAFRGYYGVTPRKYLKSSGID